MCVLYVHSQATRLFHFFLYYSVAVYWIDVCCLSAVGPIILLINEAYQILLP